MTGILAGSAAVCRTVKGMKSIERSGMSDHRSTLKSIFLNALEIPSAEARQAYVVAKCGGNDSLTAEVEELLRQHGDLGSFLELPPAARCATWALIPPSEIVGTVIGPYKLLQQIGEGGMGVVFMAEQQQPVQRKVALKIIKPGMDTRQVVARFEAERQALALMDHPNIAKVLDAGATEAGRPYFVMELVKGMPITAYCDEHHLAPRERLELFAPVCQAVQHAHQKGIIHRDLKPSNVMVALYDGKPVPKIIDFGVVKATGQRLTERTMFTEYGAVVGTIEYMSPEQAELNQLDIDTRSDIYSLGVLLYELLTSMTPFEKGRLRSATFDEMLRIIREEEPPKPSTRLSTTNELKTIAANRGLEPAKLSGLMRGELDWIVMKCLEKDRNRRYQTATGLYEDIERYLVDRPVQACPPSAIYKIRKFVKRKKRVVAMASALVVVLLAAIGVAAGSIGWAVRDRQAQKAVVEHEVGSALEMAKIAFDQDKLLDAAASIREAESLSAANEIRPDLRRHVQQWSLDLAMVRQLEEVQLERVEVHDVSSALGVAQGYRTAFHRYGFDLGRSDPREFAERIRESPIRLRLIAALDDWATFEAPEGRREVLALIGLADDDPWRHRLRDAIVRRDRMTLENLASGDEVLSQPPLIILHLARQLRDDDAAINLLRRVQHLHPTDFCINESLGFLLINAHPDDAAGFFRTAIASRPDSPGAKASLGVALLQGEKLTEAESQLRDALRLKPDLALAKGYLGSVLEHQGKMDAAEAEYQGAIRLNPKLLYLQHWIADFWLRNRNWLGAKQAYEKAIQSEPSLAPPYEELAVLLCLVPDIRLRDPSRAAEVAAKAVQLDPVAYQGRRALGLAQFRGGQWQASLDSLENSRKLRPADQGEDAATLLVIAIDSWRLGRKDEARKYYAQGEGEVERSPPSSELVYCLQAETALLLGERLSPGLRLHLARSAVASHDLDSAAAEYAAAIDASEDNSNWDSPRKRVCREVALSDEVFGRVVALRPKEADLWVGRGDNRILRRAWSAATDEFAKAIDPPSVQDTSFEYAALLLLLGDSQGYQKFCRRLAGSVGDPASGEDAFIMARTTAIGPAEAVEPQQVVAWAERAVKDDSRPWQLHVLGLALFRIGQFDLAMSRLEESNSGQWAKSSKAQNWLVQAMIESRRGHRDEACRLVDRARQAMREVEPKVPNEPVRANVSPTDWVELAVLLREAEAMIEPTGTSKDGSTVSAAAR